MRTFYPFLLLALSLLAAPVAAQPTRVPPRLLAPLEPEYPASELAMGREVDVVLRIEIDAEGRVVEASVVESGGAPFDEAARAAVLAARFAPALRDGQPVAARVQFRVTLRPPEVTPEPQASATGTSAEGEETSTGDSEDVAPADGATGDRFAATDAAEHESEDDEGEPVLGVTAEVDDPTTSSVRSAEAVHVVDTRAHRVRSADLGDVLAREHGVAVRRTGGLGSGMRFSLNGLQDDQIRIFLDGVPLALSFPAGIANVPLGMLERVEIHRGVVPIRLGADALGGAVNLVSSESGAATRASASYQVGSFGTYRGWLFGRVYDEPTGFVASVTAFADHSDNDYPIQVEVADLRGALTPVTVPRFHDAYDAWGGTIELGFLRRPWARRLSLRLFGSRYDKELQHNLVMSVPYGEVEYGEHVLGGAINYEQPELLGENTAVEAVAAVAYRQTDFIDAGEWRYDWLGRRIRRLPRAGEMGQYPTDQSIWQWTFFGRIYARWMPHPEHELRLSLTPQFVTRTGDERIESNPDGRDPLSARRDLFTLVSGLEYRMSVLEDRLENIAFVKHYLYVAESEEVMAGYVFRPLHHEHNRVGVGDALRVRFADWIWAKASYELATRLPNPDEVFGDGVLILPNLTLAPETSHNVNVGLNVDARSRELGRWTGELNLFARLSEDLIVFLSDDRRMKYQNVYGATALGAELALGWSSPGRYLSIDVNGTFQDVRNSSEEGDFGAYAGDRIPHRPWLFANARATLRWPDALARGDALTLAWDTHYVHEFFRTWESQGLRESKQVVPSQLVHGIALSYELRGPVNLTSTLEVQNLTDEQTFDFIGVQRPGRSFFFKVTAEL